MLLRDVEPSTVVVEGLEICGQAEKQRAALDVWEKEVAAKQVLGADGDASTSEGHFYDFDAGN
jgi:hypothetical protein